MKFARSVLGDSMLFFQPLYSLTVSRNGYFWLPAAITQLWLRQLRDSNKTNIWVVTFTVGRRIDIDACIPGVDFMLRSVATWQP